MPVSLDVPEVPDEPRAEPAARVGPGDLWDRVQHRVRATATRLPAAEILELREHDRS